MPFKRSVAGSCAWLVVAAACSENPPRSDPSPQASGGGGVNHAGAPSGGAAPGGGPAITAGTSGSGGSAVDAGGGGSSSGGESAAAAGGGGGGGAGGGVTRTPLDAPLYNGRRGKELNAGWRFKRGDAPGADKVAFDDSTWRSLDVPHDWSIELPFNSASKAGANGGYLDGGVGWYRKTFTLDAASSGKSILIEFDGVYMNSEVFINGVSLGKRPYGYSSFEYDLTPHVKLDGTSNVLAVKVDNVQPNSRWYTGSGIYRNVWLTTLAPVHVASSGVYVTTPDVSAASARIAVTTDVENSSPSAASVTLATTITDALGVRVATHDSAATDVAAGAKASVEQSLTVAAPSLWSPKTPYLYQLLVEVKIDGAVVDRYSTSLGLRSVAFSPTSGFSLNGENMKLRGVNMHHDLGALGAAVNYRAIERQVELLESMGVNAIRTSHNPPAPELLEIADRLGVMILEEAFDTWQQPKTANDYSVHFDTWAQRDLQDMVRRDRNHPSIVLWSIGNEVGASTTSTAKNLKKWVLDIDDTRAVTWASNKMGGPHVNEGDDRNVADLLDVQGYNYADYAGNYDDDHAAHPTWTLLGTETTAALRSRGIYHTPAGTMTKATSSSRADKQCSSYDNEATNFGDSAEVAYARDVTRPFVAGSFIWAGFDYLGEPTPYGWPAKSSYFGVIDTAGFPKDVFYFYKSRWTTAPMVHLLPHWNWTSGTTVTVYAYHNCESVELFLNDASQGVAPFVGSALHSEWSIDWVAGTLRADCMNGGRVVATDTVKTAGAPAKIALSADRNRISADGKDLVFITADVQDADGVIVPNAENAISFSVTGPAQLVGVDNGNPIDTSGYKETSRKAFSGKALAIFRSTTESGSAVIAASSTGLTSTPLTVELKSPR
jgi:beta-galactosidase